VWVPNRSSMSYNLGVFHLATTQVITVDDRFGTHKVVLPDTGSSNGALILVFAVALPLALALHSLGVLLRHYL